MAKCKKCGAEIKFIKKPNGKWQVCDLPGKAVELFRPGDLIVGENGIVERVMPDLAYTSIKFGYVDHHATCPYADEFRKPKKQQEKAALRDAEREMGVYPGYLDKD